MQQRWTDKITTPFSLCCHGAVKLRTERIWRRITIRVLLGRVGAGGEVQASVRVGFVQ